MHIGVAGKKSEYQIILFIILIVNKDNRSTVGNKDTDKGIQYLPDNKRHPDKCKKDRLRQNS